MTSSSLGAATRPRPGRSALAELAAPDWSAPRWFQQRPFTLTAAICLAVVGTVVGVHLAAPLFGDGLDTLTQRAGATYLMAAGLVLLLFRWRAWTAIGFTRPRQWRDLRVMWLPLLLAAWPFIGGLQVSWAALALAVLAELPNSFLEEGLFRGVVVRAMAGRSVKGTILLSGAGFAVLHLVLLVFGEPVQNVLPLVVITFLFGMSYAALRIRTGTIWPALLVHGTWNVANGTGGVATVLGDGGATIVLLIAAVVAPAYGFWLVRGMRHLDQS
jgi:membrane protease YdiL (CAAX protease family)